MLPRATILLPGILLCVTVFGCGENPDTVKQRETIVGLQEQVENRNDRVAELRSDKGKLEAEIKSRTAETTKEFEERIEALKSLHTAEVSKLKGTITSLTLTLTQTRKENLVLRDIVDQQPRLDRARTVEASMQVMVTAVLVGILLFTTLYVGLRHWALRERLCDLVMQRSAELARIGGGTP